MIDKNQLAADLFKKYGPATKDDLYGVFLDGNLLDIRDRHGAFFSTQKGANQSILSHCDVLHGYKHSLPRVTALYNTNEYYDQYKARRDAQDVITKDYKAAVKELIKDGRLEIKKL